MNSRPTEAMFSVADYKGPDYCGTCHSDKYQAWSETKHKEAYSDPIFQAVWNASGQPSYCLKCHTTGYNEDTGEFALEGVTCERCHGGPGEMQKNLNAELCGECHTDAHHPTFEEWNASEHSTSIEDLAAIGMDKTERCLSCHSAEGAIATMEGEEWSVDQAKTPITCATCHNPHELELRKEPSSLLCGQCHGGQYALWSSDSPHGIVDVQCSDCHMYTRPYVSEEEPAMTGHTFEIIEEDGKPIVCQNCHGVLEGIPSYETAVATMESIQSRVTALTLALEGKINEVKALMSEVNQTEGIDPSVIEQANTILGEAEHTFEIEIQRAHSRGFHNPAGMIELINEVMEELNNATTILLDAKAEAALSELSTSKAKVSQMQSTIDSLKTQIDDLKGTISGLEETKSQLEARISELEETAGMVYPYLGIGLIIGLIIGGIAVYMLKRK